MIQKSPESDMRLGTIVSGTMAAAIAPIPKRITPLSGA